MAASETQLARDELDVASRPGSPALPPDCKGGQAEDARPCYFLRAEKGINTTPIAGEVSIRDSDLQAQACSKPPCDEALVNFHASVGRASASRNIPARIRIFKNSLASGNASIS